MAKVKKPEIVVLDQDPQDGVDYLAKGKNAEIPRKIGKNLKRAYKVAKTAVVIAGVAVIANEIHDFNFGLDSEHKSEVEVGPAKSTVREDVYVNLGQVESKFDLRVETLNNRPGPIDCSAEIDNTGKNKVKTTTDFGVRLEAIKYQKGDQPKLVVSGDLEVSTSNIDWSDTPLKFSDLNWNDLCWGTGEHNAALNTAVTTAVHAGEIATSCALSDPESSDLIGSALIKDAQVHGLIEEGEKPTFEFPDLQTQLDAYYGENVRKFDHALAKVTSDYPGESQVNAEGIRDCKKHAITVLPPA